MYIYGFRGRYMKYLFKITLSLLLFMGLLSDVVVPVSATEEDIEGSFSFREINPEYEGLIAISEDDIANPEIPASPQSVVDISYISESEAVEFVRNELRSRNTSFSFSAIVHVDSPEEKYEKIGDYVKSVVSRSMDHIGSPYGNCGDYLKWHYAGYRCTYSYYTDDKEYGCTFNFEFSYMDDSAKETVVTNKLNQVYSSLGISQKSTLDKIRAIYDYITTNVTYDYDHLNDSSYMLKYTAYAALINGTAVCQGYANLLYRMMVDNGIDARFIAGLGNGGRHGWNIVKYVDKYYNMDSTWDAPRKEAGVAYDYYMRCPSDFNSNHQRDSEYTSDVFMSAYPMSSFSLKDMVLVQSISLEQNTISLKVGDGYSLGYTIQPSNATYKGVNFSSSNSSIAGVSNSGTITAKSVGTATITAKTIEGDYVDKCTVTVSSQVIEASGVSLNKTSLTLAVGDSETLVATVSPSNATDKSLAWSSSNSSIVTVDSSGKVNAVKAGTATIVVKTSNNKIATCNVTIEERSYIDIAEGTYTNYVSAGESIDYRFIPIESGSYYFYGNGNEKQYAYVSLMDSDRNSISKDEKFVVYHELEAGKTYYYHVRWENGNEYGDMTVNLREENRLVIEEGTHPLMYGFCRRTIYHFTPKKDGFYYFDSHDSGFRCSFEIRDESQTLLDLSFNVVSVGNFLEAGKTYTFEIDFSRDRYSRIGDYDYHSYIAVKLRKLNPINLEEGVHTSYVEKEQTIDYCFTPNQDGCYQIVCDGNDDIETTLFEKGALSGANPEQSFSPYGGKKHFYFTFGMKAGKTYYFSNKWENPESAGNITVKIIKPESRVIEEGSCLNNLIKAGNVVEYRFTPKEETTYYFKVDSNRNDQLIAKFVDVNYPYYYEMEVAGDGRIPFNTCLNHYLETGRTYYYIVGWSDESISDDITVTLKKKPKLSIVSQPKDSWAAEGQKVSTSVVAQGENLGYQWFYSNDGGKSFSNSSIKSATYSTTMSSSVNGRQVYCIVSDGFGSYAISDTVTLHMAKALKITNQPEDIVGKENATVKATVSATGEGLSYKWYYKTNGTTIWKPSGLTGYKTSTLSVVLNETNAGRTYKCVVTDAYGITVETREVSARIARLAITKEPEDVVGKSGQTLASRLQATSSEQAALSYQWQFKTKGTDSWKSSGYAGATTETLQVPINSTSAGRLFRCMVTDAYGNVAYTRDVAVSIRTPLAITRQPVDLVGQSGSTVSTSMAASGDGLKYQWYFQNAGTTAWKKSGYAGYSTASMNIPVNSTSTSRLFKCVVTDQYGQSVETRTITVSVPVITITSQPTTVGGLSGTTVKATVKATGSGLKYQWKFKTKGTTTWINSGLAGNATAELSIPISATNTNRLFKCVLTDAYGTMKETGEIEVVASSLKITQQPTNLQGASGDTVKAIIKATGSGLKYQWYFLSDGTSTWKKSGFTGNATATMTIPVSVSSTGRSYKCVVTDKYGLTVESDVIRVVMSSIKILSQPMDIVSEMGALEEATVKASGNGLKYQWYFKTTGTGDWKKSGYEGNTTPTLEIPINSNSLKRVFKCVITDSAGTSLETREVSVKLGVPNNRTKSVLY